MYRFQRGVGLASRWQRKLIYGTNHSNNAVGNMEWIEAEGMTARYVLWLAKTSLAERLNSKVAAVCGRYVPMDQYAEIATAVKSGLQSGCCFLLKNPRDISDASLWRGLFALPKYWEPPVLQCEPLWPRHQRQAYRWAASILAYSVRTALEDLHASYIPDELMPSLNRTVRSSIYENLISTPSLGWRLSKMPRAFLLANAQSRLISRLPSAVG